VPIFIPKWWPHSWYNTRYGMEMLPAFALGLGFGAHSVLVAVREFKPRWVKYTAILLGSLAVWNAWKVTAEKPLTYVEGTKNIEARRPFEQQIPPLLRKLLAQRQPGAPVLIKTSAYPNLVAFTGIPLRQTLNEGDGDLYRAALDAPAQRAAIVVAFAGDEIDEAVKKHPEGLRPVGRFTAPGNAAGTAPIVATVATGTSRIMSRASRRSRSGSSSATKQRSPPRRACQARSVSSPPIPAGSPMVSARGRIG